MASNLFYIPTILLEAPRNPIFAVGLPVALGLLSGSPTANVVRGPWYNNLRFPPGRPPRQVFPIVWTSLYAAMGYASYVAAKALDSATLESTRSKLVLGLGLYYAQLVLNFSWTPLFFGARKTGWALVDNMLLASTTFYMTKLLNEGTGGRTTWALVPYCAWLTFANYLNGGIWWLNRGRSEELKRLD